MAAASLSKSPSSPSPYQMDPTMTIVVPPEDLTCHNFGGSRHQDLTDRQLFAWAYQTETRVRFDKLEGRSSHSPATQSNEALSSDYLLDVYPGEPTNSYEFDSILERDQHAFQRKAANFLTEHKPQDGSLTPIQIDDPEVSLPSPYEENLDAMLPVPPNFLYYELILECFVGYDLRYIFNASDPTLPQPAIMGGAVVAALSSWNDEYIVSLFQEADLEECLTNYNAKVASMSEKYPARKRALTKMLQEEYVTRKNQLTKILHEYFLSTGDEDGQFSIYHAGDVDVFLQSPVLPRELFQSLLQKSGNADIVSNIQSFIGGIGWCHDSLQAFAAVVYGHLSTKYEAQGGFVFALAKNGLSSMYAPWTPGYEPEPDQIQPVLPWPRNTQLIMMDPRADLLGAIMDFDISTAACAFDGHTVRITPRSALSLVRRVGVVTPFCFEEKRNRRRLMKYVRRGFFPAIVDPHCLHETPCQNSYSARIAGPPAQTNDQHLVTKKCWEWHSPGGTDFIEEWRRVSDEARESTRNQKVTWGTFVLDGGPKDPVPLQCCCNNICFNLQLYMIEHFEERDGHALAFFAELNNWDDTMRRKVARIPKQLREACQRCRFRYAMFVLLQEGSPDDDATWDDMDLHKDKAILRAGIRDTYFRPSFYSGGAFDSTLVREKARHFHQAQSVILGQSIAEQLRYVVEHGSTQGYQQRFTCYNDYNIHWNDPDLQAVFDEAMKTPLASPARPPLGLNPERFLATCQGCSKWLHGCEFGTDFCSQCQQS